jgi:CRISPR-associated Csx2 family protein
MPRKLLLSFLGTNNYLECNYYQENQPDKKVDDVKYIQEALVKLYCKDFSNQDQVLMLLTEKAEQMNFWDDGQYNKETKHLDLPNIGLNSKLQKLQTEGFQFTISHKRIKEGFSQVEIWSIFETVAGEIQEGDQIIFDITHAFRFLPMLGIVLLNYLKVTKNITVLGIHYGAFEKLGSFQEVFALDIKDRNAPIIDLNTLLEFQSWTSAVNSFIKFGETNELRDASQSKIKSVIAESRGSDLAAKDLKYVIDQLSILTSNLQTNRLNILLDQDFTIFKEKIEKLPESDIAVKPFKQILKLIENKVSPIITSKELIWLESAKWCLEHKLVQQAYTQLQEGLLTYSMQLFEMEINSKSELKSLFEKHLAPITPERRDITHRLFFSSLLNFIYKTSQNKLKESSSLDLFEISKFLQTDFFIQLGRVYAHITEPRNDINHAGIRNDPMKAESLQKRIGELISQVETLLKP